MNKKCLISILALFAALRAPAATPAPFAEPEANFKAAMDALAANYSGSGATKAELYRAATAGMLASLNVGRDDWNKLLAPEDFAMLQEELSGKVGGVGLGLNFDAASGHGTVVGVVPGSPAERAGLRRDDQILSVNGRSFKGRTLRDMIAEVRGAEGATVKLKILRGESVIAASLKRAKIAVDPVSFAAFEGVGVLEISYFNERTPELTEAALRKAIASGQKKLVLDLRGNEGGGFDQAVRTIELFAPKGATVAQTRDRAGKIEKHGAGRGVLPADARVWILAGRETKSGAELFAASVQEMRRAPIVGEATFGKWSAQTVEKLPNGFAIKYTVEEFQTAGGKSYGGVGLKPTLEVPAKEGDALDKWSRLEPARRLAEDRQLRAALELARATP